VKKFVSEETDPMMRSNEFMSFLHNWKSDASLVSLDEVHKPTKDKKQPAQKKDKKEEEDDLVPEPSTKPQSIAAIHTKGGHKLEASMINQQGQKAKLPFDAIDKKKASNNKTICVLRVDDDCELVRPITKAGYILKVIEGFEVKSDFKNKTFGLPNKQTLNNTIVCTVKLDDDC